MNPRRSRRPPQWLWAWLGVLGLLAAAVAVIGPAGAPALVATTLVFAGFYLLVGLGQMVLITAGNGHIDLSIPAVMTLAAYVALGRMAPDGTGIVFGLAMGLGTGLLFGLANAFLVVALRIPPMIGTLACGFIGISIATAISRGTTAPPPPFLGDLAIARVAGVPVVALVAVAAALVLGFAMERTVFGRSVTAIGQNLRAARFAGLAVERTLVGAYLLSATLAAGAGVLFASYSGGASLGMAESFLIVSIAVVVLGGTDVAGGSASVMGLAGASAFFYLAVTVLNILQLNPGLRSIITGAVIIAVLALASRRGPA